MPKTKKNKVIEEARASIKIQEIVDDFNSNRRTKKFLAFSSQRSSKYLREVDRDFYELVQDTIQKLAKLVVLTNANKMFHLVEYKRKIQESNQNIKGVVDEVLKRLGK